MKQIDLIRGYGALKRLSSESLPISDAYGIFTVCKQIEPQYMFEMEQEKKILSEVNGTVAENGDLHFDTPEQAKEFQERVSELQDMDVALEIKPITIKMSGLNQVRIRPEDFGFLSPFVKFE